MMKIFSESNFKNFLSALFDYQRFDSNPHLAAVLRSDETEQAQNLDENDLDQLSAAGIGYENPPKLK